MRVLTLTSAFLFSRVLAAVMRNKTMSELENSRTAELKRHLTLSANVGFQMDSTFMRRKVSKVAQHQQGKLEAAAAKYQAVPDTAEATSLLFLLNSTVPQL